MKGKPRAAILCGCIVILTWACAGGEDRPGIAHEISLKDRFFEGKAAILDLPDDHGFKIVLTDSSGHQLDRVIFSYPYYRFDSADINRDGRTEILIGLIKKTEFDPTPKKRMFILRI